MDRQEVKVAKDGGNMVVWTVGGANDKEKRGVYSLSSIPYINCIVTRTHYFRTSIILGHQLLWDIYYFIHISQGHTHIPMDSPLP